MINELTLLPSRTTAGRGATRAEVGRAQDQSFKSFAIEIDRLVEARSSSVVTPLGVPAEQSFDPKDGSAAAAERAVASQKIAHRGAENAEPCAVFGLAASVKAEAMGHESVSQRAEAEMAEQVPAGGEGAGGLMQDQAPVATQSARVAEGESRRADQGRKGQTSESAPAVQDDAASVERKPVTSGTSSAERSHSATGEQESGKDSGPSDGQREGQEESHRGAKSALGAASGNLNAVPDGVVRSSGRVEVVTGSVREAGSASPVQTVGGARGQASAAKWLDRVSGSTARPMLAPEPMPVAIQAGKAMAQAVRDGEGTVTLRLAPEALGPVTIRMTLEEGVVSAMIECSTSDAREMLEGGKESLRASMEARGLHVGTLEMAPVERGSESSQEAGVSDGSSGHRQESKGNERGPGGSSSDARAGEGNEQHAEAMTAGEGRGVWLDPVSMRLEAWA